jgi:phosphatidylglycerophosphatase A
MIKKFNLLFLTCFQIGKLKIAPGTIASLFTCIVFLLLINFFSLFFILFFTIVIFLYSLNAINNSYQEFDTKDPQEIVIDEFVGQMLPLLAIPIYETLYPASKLFYCFVAFLLFRFFDILKPFPINYIDKNTEGALGVMLDDIVSGFFTIIIMTIAFFFIGG